MQRSFAADFMEHGSNGFDGKERIYKRVPLIRFLIRQIRSIRVPLELSFAWKTAIYMPGVWLRM